VLFPALSRRAADRDGPGFRALVGSGLRQIAFLLIPAAAICAALATPIVRLLYEHGSFSPENTEVVASCLAAFSLGLAFNGAMLLLNRAFFSMQRAWVPTTIAIANLAVNATLDYVLSSRLGVWSIPLSTSIANIVGVALLYIQLRPVAGRLDEREIVRTIVRIVVATVLSTAAAYGVWRMLDSMLGQFVPFQVLSLGMGLATSVVVYMLAAHVMKIEELQTVLALLRRRRSKPAPA
jgi:putative peptidoglycan lipid II flippase